MKLNNRILASYLFLIAGLLTFSSCEKDQLIEPGQTENLQNGASASIQNLKRTPFYGLTSSNEIVRFSSGNTTADQEVVMMTGMLVKMI